MSNCKRGNTRGLILLDFAVILMVMVLVLMLQLSINHRNGVNRREAACQKQMKWIAKAQEGFYTEHAQYADRFRKLAPQFRNLSTFVCPTSQEIYSLWVDEVGRYTVECQFAGHGAIVSGDPTWE